MSLTSSRGKAFTLALALVALRSGIALADVSAENHTAAQALFDEGRSLVKAGRLQNACPKFEESLRLDPGVGTQLNLADCYERTGRTASAWTLYIEVVQGARQSGQAERASFAATRVAALKDKLSRLVIVVPQENRAPGLTVARGSLTIGEAQWGAAMPVDPGPHVVKVSAPGKEPWQTTVTLPADGSTKTVTVPLLKDGAVAADSGSGVTTAAVDLTSKSGGSSQHTAAYVVGGLGVAGLAVGSVFGALAISKKSEAHCNGNACANDDQRNSYEQAQKNGKISTIAFVVGGAALAGGVILYFSTPKKGASASASLSAHASPGMVGISAGAKW